MVKTYENIIRVFSDIRHTRHTRISYTAFWRPKLRYIFCELFVLKKRLSFRKKNQGQRWVSRVCEFFTETLLLESLPRPFLATLSICQTVFFLSRMYGLLWSLKCKRCLSLLLDDQLLYRDELACFYMAFFNNISFNLWRFSDIG